MSLDQALNDATSAIPECVAAGVVDLDSGMLLGVKTVDSHPSEVLDVVAAATADLFQGTNVVMIENLFKLGRGLPEDDGHHYFQEMVVLSDNLMHFFLRSKAHANAVAIFVTRKSANMGMALTKSRAAIPSLEAAL